MDKNATFGQRRARQGPMASKGRTSTSAGDGGVRHMADGGMEMTFVPRTTASSTDHDDYAGGSTGVAAAAKRDARRKGVETFGAGMERGGGGAPEVEMSEAERKGRTKRRQGMRSGSKNTFRRM